VFHSLLVPLDGSEFSERSLPLARGIARATGASLHLAHVHVPHLPDHFLSNTQFHFEGLSLREYDRHQWKREREYLDSVLERFDEDEAAVDATLLEGDIADELATYAEDTQTDVIFMTTHGQTGANRLWLDSVADTLVRHAHRPTLVLHPTHPEAVPADVVSFKHIVVQLDGSDVAERALEPAIEMAEATAARITLVHIVSARASLGTHIFPILPDDVVLSVVRAREYLERVADRLAARGVTVGTYVGKREVFATGIAHAAKELDADLIALATHGYGGVKRTLLGSVAGKVLRASPLPLMILRPGKTA
jgi:nucleotide-binding universal stress UspA family protein